MSYMKVTYCLGFSGLFPFLGGLVLSATQYKIYGISGATIFTTYSLAILCFLAGAVWGQILRIESSPTQQMHLIMTNIFVVVGWFAFLTSQKLYALGVAVLMLVFACIFFLEINLFEVSTIRQNAQYSRLRKILTSLVVAAHAGMVVIHV
tara:strand:- start:84 stop:533 length:450 start_codon:yes stop_codon:yes gene_type:complete